MAHELYLANGFLTGNQSTFGPGTAALAPIQFTLTGSVLESSVDAGDLEVDSTGMFYYAQQASSRQVVDCEQVITLTTAFTTATGTANTLKALFNSPANGTLTVAGNITYFFECFFTVTAMSATSGTFSFGFGGTATYTRSLWMATGLKAAITNATAITSVYTAVTGGIIGSTTGNTTTTGFAYTRGKLVIGTGGTIIPSIALSVAAACVIGNDSYFRITPVGANTVQSVGNWS